MKIPLLCCILLLLIGTVAAQCEINLASDYNVTGDGTDEWQKLNNALVYAGNNSPCTIDFPESKLIIIGSRLTTPGNTTINGKNSTLKIKDGYATSSTVLTLGSHNYVHRLKYDGNWKGINQNYKGSVMGIGIGDYTIFEDNEISNSTAYTLWSYHTSHWIVRNNFIHDGTQYGIATGAGSVTNPTENATVTGNIIWNMSEVGIKIRGTNNSTISGNTVVIPDGLSFSSVGICLYSNDASNKNIQITDNTIGGDYTNTTGSGTGISIGIQADPPPNPDSVIEDNIINSTYRGTQISSDDIIIRNNQISNSRYTGVYIATANRTQVTGNTLTNAGIIIIGSSTKGNNNNISQNTISGGNQYWRAKGDGIFIWYGGSNNTIDGNTISVDRYGIDIYDTFGKAQNTSVTNNQISASWACIFDQGINTYDYGNVCNGQVSPPWWRIWSYYLRFHLTERLI